MEMVVSLIASGRYSDLKRLLEKYSTSSLIAEWKSLKPLERLVVFKLLALPKALEFYAQVDDSEKYFLFCGLGAQSIAPVLENLSDRERGLFVEIPKNIADDMLVALMSKERI